MDIACTVVVLTGFVVCGCFDNCDYCFCCVSRTVVVLTGFVVCGCFDNCDYCFCCVSRTVVVLTGFVVCGCECVGVLTIVWVFC